MKISVRPLKGARFEIEVKPEDSIADVKKNIETLKGADLYPAAKQIIIHQGQVLKDETTIEENKVADKSFIVVMITKSKPSSTGASSVSAGTKAQQAKSIPPSASQPSASHQTSIATQVAPAPTPLPIPETATETVSAPVPEPEPASTAAPDSAPVGNQGDVCGQAASNLAATETVSAPVPVAASTPAPDSAPVSNQGDVYGQAASNLAAGSNLESTIQQILDMGGGTWTRDIVATALNAAFNNPERAVEYIYSGFPKQAAVPPVSRAPASGRQPANPPAAAAPSGPNTVPLNLFPQSLPTNSRRFVALRAMLQIDPEVLQYLLQQLQKQDPNVMRLIQDHEPDVWNKLVKRGGGIFDLLRQLGPALMLEADEPMEFDVTREESEAIDRLVAMGFDIELVLEVFFACDKNEELAANYLLDHIHEF